MRIGKRMVWVANFVRSNPGCSRYDIAKALRHRFIWAYRAIGNAYAAGLIEYRAHPTRKNIVVCYPVTKENV